MKLPIKSFFICLTVLLLAGLWQSASAQQKPPYPSTNPRYDSIYVLGATWMESDSTLLQGIDTMASLLYERELAKCPNHLFLYHMSRKLMIGYETAILKSMLDPSSKNGKLWGRTACIADGLTFLIPLIEQQSEACGNHYFFYSIRHWLCMIRWGTYHTAGLGKVSLKYIEEMYPWLKTDDLLRAKRDHCLITGQEMVKDGTMSDLDYPDWQAACSRAYDSAVYNQNGIAENMADASVEIFPNPAQDEITIRLNGAFPKAQCELFAADGRLVRYIALDHKGTHSLIGLPAGVYMLSIRTENGRHYQRRLLKLP